MKILASVLCVAFAVLAVASLQAQTVKGSGTTGTIPVWTGASKVGNSNFLQVGKTVYIGAPVSGFTFSVTGVSGIGVVSTATGGIAISAEALHGIAVSGSSTSGDGGSFSSGSGNGVTGLSTSGIGIAGSSTSANGVLGVSASSAGVFGERTSSYGVKGTSSSGVGVYGISTSGNGLKGTSVSSSGVQGTSTSSYGVQGSSTSGIGVYGQSKSNSGRSGQSTSGAGVSGQSTSGDGLQGTSSSSAGVSGTSASGYGVQGMSTSNRGVVGVSVSQRGVEGDSTSKTGVVGISAASIGVAGQSLGSTPGTSVGVFGVSTQVAGLFNGAVAISGNLAVSGIKAFRIDHPLDPANKFLTHSAIESSEVLNLYSGKVVLDGSGEALVQLPDWFEALNTDFRYQLTAIGQPGPNLHVVEEIRNNQLRIAGGTAQMKVSWQVTAVRHDAYMKAHPMQVETEKPADERGFYLHPELFGQPEGQGIVWVHHPDIMKEFKARRLAHAADNGNLVSQP